MSRFQSTYDEANELYRKSRCYDAAVMFEQARQIAREDLMAAEAAKAGVWAAISWNLAAHPMRAYTLLIDILNTAEDDLEILLRWYAQASVFGISCDYFPELDKLQQRLEALAQLQQEYPELPLADVYQLRGILLRYQGQWQAALQQYELAWVEYNGDGYLKCIKAEKAAWCNLYLGNPVAAQRWCDRLGETDTDWPNSRVAWYSLQAQLALYDGDFAQAEVYADQSEREKDRVQEGAGGPCEIRVRTLLLQAELGDPGHPTHPARFRLRQRFQGKPNVFVVYDRALLVADYRLACVRYCLGIPPVDDGWYQQGQQVPSRLPSDFQPQNFQKRVKVARRAFRLALKQATDLDGCFQCHWRQEEVQQRQTRLDELVNAAYSLLGGSRC